MSQTLNVLSIDKRNETIVHTAKVHCSYRSRIFKSELRGAK